MASLHPIFWTAEREHLLERIAEAAETYKHGKKKDWVQAIVIRNDEFRALGLTIEQLRKAWQQRQKSLKEVCMYAGCLNSAESGKLFCSKHLETHARMAKHWKEKKLVELYLKDTD